MKKLGEYENGNYKVIIMQDGTKIRFTQEDEYLPEKPESMDLKITNRCTGTNCAFCHERSGPDGEHGDIMNLKFIDTLLPYTECALGGGNVLEHPDFVPFLKKCKSKNIICNVTFNQVHFMKHIEFIQNLIKRKLIYGVGVSLLPTEKSAEELAAVLTRPIFSNAVIHVINGIHDLKVLKPLYDKDLKLLILGYKVFGRGKEYYGSKGHDIEEIKSDVKGQLNDLITHFKAISFDNLAISQLDVRGLMDQEQWEEFYMGEEGQFTMYVDAVKKEYAICSVAEERFPLEDDIRPMFSRVREKAALDKRKPNN